MKLLLTQAGILIAGLVTSVSAWSIEGLPHQAEPLTGLIVSGQPTEAQLSTMSQEGFSTVINLRQAGEFDDFDEAEIVNELGMLYVHIPVKNVAAIDSADAEKLHQAISDSDGLILLHCTVGWRAGSLLAIERYLIHEASREQAIQIATDAHMSHASGDVEGWLDKNGN